MVTDIKNPITFTETTHTAADAAKQLGCDVAQIAKSIVFRGVTSDQPILVITSGVNRVDVNKVANLVDEKVEKPNADYCKSRTGFVIGGIPPFGHIKKLKTLFDKDLLKYDTIWASAGTPNSVFKTSPRELLDKTGASCCEISLS